MITDVFLVFLKISISTSVIVAVLILLSPFLNRRYASKWKYGIWMFLAVWLIIPFSAVGGRPAAAPSQAENQDSMISKGGVDHFAGQAALPERIVVELPAQVLTPVSPRLPESNGITLLDVMAYVWALGSLVFLSVHLIGYLYYKRQILQKGFGVTDACILRQTFELKKELGIKDNLPIVKHDNTESPMVLGFIKPLLVLPEEQYSSEEMFFILKHELVHCKRKDVYAKFILIVANALHWFNPFIWIMRKEAAVDMELSCDERVTRGVDYAVRKAYTETLLSTLHKNVARKTALSTQFYGGKRIMKKRFRNILNRADRKNGVVILISAAVLTMSLGTLIGCSVEHETVKDMTENTENILENIPANIPTGVSVVVPADLSTGIPTADAAPQDGQIYGYITKLDGDSAVIDLQLWVTSESDDWKPEYNEAAGFEVVDAEGEDIAYPLSEDCKFSVLENHWYPVIELDKKEFESSLSQTEYPVLWVMELSGGQIVRIEEQYRP